MTSNQLWYTSRTSHVSVVMGIMVQFYGLNADAILGCNMHQPKSEFFYIMQGTGSFVSVNLALCFPYL